MGTSQFPRPRVLDRIDGSSKHEHDLDLCLVHIFHAQPAYGPVAQASNDLAAIISACDPPQCDAHRVNVEFAQYPQRLLPVGIKTACAD